MKQKFAGLIFTALSIYCMTASVHAAEQLIPVGEVIGLEVRSGTVTVAAFDETLTVARDAGVRIGDEIVSIDDVDVDSADDVRSALNHSDGAVDLVVSRSGETRTIHMEPEITAAGPKLGVYLRQGITGIGTVTFYDPQTDTFGALGHAVSDGKGQLLNMTRGSAYPATVVSVEKGKSGHPGQLKGGLKNNQLLGTLTENTSRGIFGTAPDAWSGEAIPVAAFDQVRTGEAAIRSTIDGGAPRDYSVEILKIYPKDRADGRNLLIRVTDPVLLAATGGIVQGMSGSPIIQDGKLVGAVTHVLVNDPTRGYGIFIENMLEAAE